jgi:hypothetical protein
MERAEFKETAYYCLALMEFMTATSALSGQLYKQGDRLRAIGLRMGNLEMDLLSSEQARLVHFLSNYQTVSSGWLGDEEIADIHRRIADAEKKVLEVQDSITLLQDTFDDDGDFESTAPPYPFIAIEIRKAVGSDENVYRENLYQLIKTLEMVMKADEISLTEACRIESPAMPATIVSSYFSWLRDLGLVKFNSDTETYSLTPNGINLIKEVHGRIDEIMGNI